MELETSVLKWKLKNPIEYHIKYITNYGVTRYMFVGSHYHLTLDELRDILSETDFYVDEDDEIVTAVYLIDVWEEDPELIEKTSVRIRDPYNLRIL